MSASEGTLHFEVASGNAAGTTLVVDERLVIGRQSESVGRLGDDPELSRHHAEISRQADGTYVIEDLASTNGTLVNGTRITEPTLLTANDSVEVGATTLRVASAPTAPRPGVDARAATITVETPPEMREPPAPAESPPPAAPPTVETPRRPRLELRLVVDPELGEAEIHLDGEAEPLRLSFRDGGWQPLGGDS